LHKEYFSGFFVWGEGGKCTPCTPASYANAQTKPIKTLWEIRNQSKYLSPVRSDPKKLTTPTLNTKLENTVKRPAIPATAIDN